MAQFPKREAEIRALAQTIGSGLAANPADFPMPPVASAALQALLNSFIVLCDEAVSARAAAEEATAKKAVALTALISAMKSDLRYAEDAVHRDDAKLSALGWGAVAPPTPLAIPGQPGDLQAVRQGEGWVFLDWKQPAEGGIVAAYKIERRERPAGDWMVVGMAITPKVTLNNQERGKDWEYRVIASNRAGEGVPSNSVAAVL